MFWRPGMFGGPGMFWGPRRWGYMQPRGCCCCLPFFLALTLLPLGLVAAAFAMHVL